MKIIECPRDAMQGIERFIPTDYKIRYINQLLKIGFDTIDFGSFVSAEAIPQLKDTADVLNGLDLSNTSTKLLAIIANYRGAMDACYFDAIDYLGFPLSVSEEFQQRNTNKSIDQALQIVEKVQDLCVKKDKELVVYLSMAFGNPYEDYFHPDIVSKLTEKLSCLDIRTIALSDTIGVSKPDNITSLFTTLISEYPLIEFGAHFHAKKRNWREKVEAAYKSGCRRFDSALKGYGGCPMVNDKLVGNMPTEKLLAYFKEVDINKKELFKSLQLIDSVFS